MQAEQVRILQYIRSRLAAHAILDSAKGVGRRKSLTTTSRLLLKKSLKQQSSPRMSFWASSTRFLRPKSMQMICPFLASLGGGHLACVHPPPDDVPENVKAGMIFAVNDIVAPVGQNYVTPALQKEKLKYLPQSTIVEKDLRCI